MRRHSNPRNRRHGVPQSLALQLVAGFMIASGIGLVVLGLFGNDTDAHRRGAELCADLLKGGFGAILALLGTTR